VIVRWSWRIARVAGIGIYVHATFLILPVWVGVDGYRRGGTAGALDAVLFILAVFATVVLHELGHALTARRYGIHTRDITLLPIGGVARLERMPREPKQEFLIAIAGPAVNVVIATILFLVLSATGGVSEAFAAANAPDGEFVFSSFAAGLLRVNILLVLFNLIPAFPMDGGRVLRAILAWRTGDFPRATETAARVGRFFALLLGLAGLFIFPENPFLVFIALFVWLGAAAEANAVRQTATLEGVNAERVMVTDVRTLSPNDPLSHAIELTLAGFQQDFPVLENGTVVGVLTRGDLLRALSERGASTPVATAMHREFQVATVDEPVEEALGRLKACNCQAVPVVRGQQLVGVLTLDNVGEYVAFQTALRGQRA
jgi:Zn-dependent protease/CBS domain-containing protein